MHRVGVVLSASVIWVTSWQPALPWQAVCTQWVVRGLKC